MSWFVRRSPFGRDEDPLDHMMELLSDEAIRDRVLLTERDREILAKETSRVEPMPEVLRQRAKDLMTRIFEAEPFDGWETDPKSVARWNGQAMADIRVS